MEKERKELDQSQRGECSEEWTNKGGLRLCGSEEVDLSGFNSWVVVGPFHGQLVPAICYCIILLTSFLRSLRSYEKQQLFMKKGLSLMFPPLGTP